MSALVGALATLAVAPSQVHARVTSISVAATHPGALIQAAVFGSDFLAPFGGMGSYDDSIGGFWPSFASALNRDVYVGSLRFPGGTTSQSYQWQRAIGPQFDRADNPAGPMSGPSPSTVGPDEFGQLLDQTGTPGVMTVNFDTGTAQQAAELVQYMTGAPGSSVWADLRVADGHVEPYEVPYWEVGNEEYAANGWRAGVPVDVGGDVPGCQSVVTCEYIYGGTTSFSRQRVVMPADRRASAAVSAGTANQTFEVADPPVQPGATAIEVGGQSWTQIASLTDAGPLDLVYTLDPATGTVQFGDGLHGAIPQAGQTVTASYDSGPHDGFEQFYAAMKQANPTIHVCATDSLPDFLEAMGSTSPYDCLQDHPYVSSSDVTPSEPLSTYELQVMGAVGTEASAVRSLRSEIHRAAGHAVPLVLSEYGQFLDTSPTAGHDPYYLDSLDEALFNASQLAAWIRLGIPVADRQLLDAELPSPLTVTNDLPEAAPFAVTGAIITPGLQRIVEPTGEYLQLMSPLAGGHRLTARTTSNPELTTPTGDHTSGINDQPIRALSVVAAATATGLALVVINRSPSLNVASRVILRGVSGSEQATVTTLDGPSALSRNTANHRKKVGTSSRTYPERAGRIKLTLPAHSISLMTVGGTPSAVNNNVSGFSTALMDGLEAGKAALGRS